ncbi:hypothetical protein LBMAG38_16150 [Chloroflexota bacterium]|nr:hypothetical protein LBMAG38_16150 [Chloroflexota bacterium]
MSGISPVIGNGSANAMDRDHASKFCGENLFPKATVASMGKLDYIPLRAYGDVTT